MKLDNDLELDSRNLITYKSSDGDYAFFQGYDTDLVGNLIKECQERANSRTCQSSISESPKDIGSNFDKNEKDTINEINLPMLTDEELSEARRNAEEHGLMGETIINNYLDHLTRIGGIKSFEWISKNERYSAYDFCIIDNNDVHISVDVKSTDKEFNQRFYISYGELKQMAYGEERYDIYRVFQMHDLSAKLRISKDLRSFAKRILGVFAGLPEGVIPDSVSVSTSLLPFDYEIDLLHEYESQL